MKYCDLLDAEITLSNASRHLSNRIAYLTSEGLALPPGPETDAIQMLTVLHARTVMEREEKKLRDSRRKKTA
jgi:hypothetical protein